MKRQLLNIVVTSAVLTSVGFAVNWGKHPHLHKAKEHIDHARKQLSEANDHKKTEFGGHRAKAVELLNQAEAEIDAAAEYADLSGK